MRIVVLSTWHRRSGNRYYVKALRALGHEVFTVGSWKRDEPFGTRGREPQHVRDRQPPHFMWDEVAVPYVEALFVIDGGEDLRVCGVASGVPWAYISTEGGAYMSWSRQATPYRYAEIMCNGADDGVQWLPKAFDADDHCNLFLAPEAREYDLVQLASARAARRWVWDVLQRTTPDLHCVFGDIWGPLYATAYQHALSTYVCSTQDFVTTRVFEAMAMGAVVFADRTNAMARLFENGRHYIGYAPMIGPDGEGYPDPAWLVEQVRRLRREPHEAARITGEAYRLVAKRDSYTHRVRKVLADMGLE